MARGVANNAALSLAEPGATEDGRAAGRRTGARRGIGAGGQRRDVGGPAAFFVPARRVRLALQPNEAGLPILPIEPSRPPETIPSAGRAAFSHPSRSTIRRTGRLLTPSMPVSSSAFPAQPAAAVVAHPGDDVAQAAVPPPGVRLVDHLHLAAAVALDAQEPRRERGERLAHGLGASGQRLGAVAAPVPRGIGRGVMLRRKGTAAADCPTRRRSGCLHSTAQSSGRSDAAERGYLSAGRLHPSRASWPRHARLRGRRWPRLHSGRGLAGMSRRAMLPASRCGACCVLRDGHNPAPLTGRRRRAIPEPRSSVSRRSRFSPLYALRRGGGAGDTVWRAARPQRHRCN